MGLCGVLPASGAPLRVSIDPGGITAMTTHADGCVRLYHLATGQLMWKAGGHGAAAEAACVTPDCRHLVTVAGDGCMMVWKLPQALATQMQQQMVAITSPHEQQVSDGGSSVASPRESAGSGTINAGFGVTSARSSGDGAGNKRPLQQKQRTSVEGGSAGIGKVKPRAALERKGRKDSSEGAISTGPASPAAAGKGAASSPMPRLQERPLPNRVPDRAAADSKLSPRMAVAPAAAPAVAGEQMIVPGRMTPERTSMPVSDSRFPARAPSASRVPGPDKAEPSEPPAGKSGGSRGATPERLRGALLGVVDAVLARVPSRASRTGERSVTPTREILLDNLDSESPSHAGTASHGAVDYSSVPDSEQASSNPNTSRFGGSQRSLKSIINRKNLKEMHASQSEEYYTNGGESFYGEASIGHGTDRSSAAAEKPVPGGLQRARSGVASASIQRTKSGNRAGTPELQRMKSGSPEPASGGRFPGRKSLDGEQYRAAAVANGTSAYSRSRSSTPPISSPFTSEWMNTGSIESSGMRKSQSGGWVDPPADVAAPAAHIRSTGDNYSTYCYQQELEQERQAQIQASEMKQQEQAAEEGNTLLRRVKQGRPLVSHNHLPRWAARASPSVDGEVPSSWSDSSSVATGQAVAAAPVAASRHEGMGNAPSGDMGGELLLARGSRWADNKDEQFSVFNETGAPVMFQVKPNTECCEQGIRRRLE